MLAEVRGRAFLGLIRCAKDARGEELFDRIAADAGPEAAHVFATRIHVTDWYPYAAYAGFLASLEHHLGDGESDFFRKLGRVAGQRDLGSLFRVYASLAVAERLIRACEKIWPSYYRHAGRMEAITWEPLSTTVRIFDFPGMAARHCRLMEGWMIATMEAIGCRVADDARESACMSTGAPHHEFQCTWVPASGAE
jgi:hypothetical protein